VRRQIRKHNYISHKGCYIDGINRGMQKLPHPGKRRHEPYHTQKFGNFHNISNTALQVRGLKFLKAHQWERITHCFPNAMPRHFVLGFSCFLLPLSAPTIRIMPHPPSSVLPVLPLGFLHTSTPLAIHSELNTQPNNPLTYGMAASFPLNCPEFFFMI
jgi:hypothetical protein